MARTPKTFSKTTRVTCYLVHLYLVGFFQAVFLYEGHDAIQDLFSLNYYEATFSVSAVCEQLSETRVMTVQ